MKSPARGTLSAFQSLNQVISTSHYRSSCETNCRIPEKRLLQALFLLLAFFSPFLAFSLRVGVIGDQTGCHDIDKSFETLQSACSQMSGCGPDIVLHVGDIIESTMNKKAIQKYFSRGAEYLSQIKGSGGGPCPWYIAAGDHDVDPPEFSPGSTDYSRETLFRELLDGKYREMYKSSAPALNGSLYYSFNFRGYHFVCLYAEDTLCADPRWGDIFLARISDRQYSWLKSDLEAITGGMKVIVFIHQPLWYNQAAWERVHKLLSSHNTVAVVAGHFHYSQVEGPVDNISYIIAGAAGGSLKDSSENAGGAPVITVLDFEKDGGVGIKSYTVSSNRPVKLVKRRNMDRIQALDMMLSTVSRDGSGRGSRNILGNPVDVPIDVYISRETGPPKWEYDRTIKPGDGVLYSNLSSVELADKNIPEDIKGVKIIFYDNDKENSQFQLQKIY